MAELKPCDYCGGVPELQKGVVFPTNDARYRYRCPRCNTYHYSGCFEVVKWRDVSTGIEVLTEEAGWMFLSEGTYILIEGDKGCPFCANHE